MAGAAAGSVRDAAGEVRDQGVRMAGSAADTIRDAAAGAMSASQPVTARRKGLPPPATLAADSVRAWGVSSVGDQSIGMCKWPLGGIEIILSQTRRNMVRPTETTQ